MNEYLFYKIYSFAHHSLFLDHVFVFSAHYLPFIAIFLAMLIIFWHQKSKNAITEFRSFLLNFREMIFVLISVSIAYLVSFFLKIIFAEPRPFESLQNIIPLLNESGFSFPSSHATFFFALAVSIFMFSPKKSILFFILAVVIGFARVAVGVHYPLDIFFGGLLGGLISWALFGFYQRFAYLK